MANALITRQSLIAVASEGTAGTAETLANGDAAMNCYNGSFTPEIEMTERTGQGTYDANLPSVPGQHAGRIGFSTDLYATSLSALWFARILRHAGFTISSDTATAVGSASTSTATVGYYVDGLRHQIAGAVASSLTINLSSGMATSIDVEYAGKYIAVADASLLSPTLPTALPIRFASGTARLNSVAMPMFSGSITIANEFAYRPDPTGSTGILHAQITRQVIRANIVIESDLVANRDDFGLMLSSTAYTMAFTLNGASSTCEITIPGMQRVAVPPGNTNGIHTRTIDFLHTGSSAASVVLTPA